VRSVTHSMSSDRAKALRDECLRDLGQARGTVNYAAYEKRLARLNALIVNLETREADERAARRTL
jgi:hypothetical protein